MIKSFLTVFIALFIVFGVNGQTRKKTVPKQSNPKKVANVVILSDLASKDICIDPTRHSVPVDGVVVKRQFDENEITLTGVVIREKDDQRYFVNIDKEYVASKGHFVPSQLSALLTKGRRVKIWVYGCGASGMMFWARIVKAY